MNWKVVDSKYVVVKHLPYLTWRNQDHVATKTSVHTLIAYWLFLFKLIFFLSHDKSYYIGELKLEVAKRKRMKLWQDRFSLSLACNLNGLRLLQYRALSVSPDRK